MRGRDNLSLRYVVVDPRIFMGKRSDLKAGLEDLVLPIELSESKAPQEGVEPTTIHPECAKNYVWVKGKEELKRFGELAKTHGFQYVFFTEDLSVAVQQQLKDWLVSKVKSGNAFSEALVLANQYDGCVYSYVQDKLGVQWDECNQVLILDTDAAFVSAARDAGYLAIHMDMKEAGCSRVLNDLELVLLRIVVQKSQVEKTPVTAVQIIDKELVDEINIYLVSLRKQWGVFMANCNAKISFFEAVLKEYHEMSEEKSIQRATKAVLSVLGSKHNIGFDTLIAGEKTKTLLAKILGEHPTVYYQRECARRSVSLRSGS